jgi:glycolate oxidase iron-sulfur subunit
VNDKTLRERLIDATDRCVKCGLCLPHCPTYGVKEDEADSPRGRIALVQGLAEGSLEPSERLWAHLTGCLECRACEAACPSLVAFGSLMDDARDLQNRGMGRWRRWTKRLRLRVLSSRRVAGAIAELSRVYRFSGLGLLGERARLPVDSRARAYHRLARQLHQPLRVPRDQTGHQRPTSELGLFLGCVAQTVQPRLPTAAWRVLVRLGYAVRIPREQRCCGAMSRHNGFPAEADRLLAQNGSAFANLRAVVTASACAAELRADPHMRNSVEISRFLADQDWPREVRVSPLRARVAVHVPCSQRNALRDADAAYALLQKIPEVEVLPLQGNGLCCGAAGTYLLENPAMSAALLTPKIDQLRELGVDFLVTTNTGCALHLAAGVREAGLGLEVIHPVELIDRQIAPRHA